MRWFPLKWSPFARKRPSSAQQAARRRYFIPFLERLETRLAPTSGVTTIAPGSIIIDMGQPTQTVNNGLRPYGLVYDLVTNYKVPVDWAINPNKTFAGNPPATPADFTATVTPGTTLGTTTTTQNFSGGPFIIEAGFLTPAVIADINSWQAKGVVVDTVAAP